MISLGVDNYDFPQVYRPGVDSSFSIEEVLPSDHI